MTYEKQVRDLKHGASSEISFLKNVQCCMKKKKSNTIYNQQRVERFFYIRLEDSCLGGNGSVVAKKSNIGTSEQLIGEKIQSVSIHSIAVTRGNLPTVN